MKLKGLRCTMIKEKKEKTCLFYASDYHFEMMILPYICKEIQNDKNIVMLTENNLEKTINTLLSKVNLNEEKQKSILKINWKSDDQNKIKGLNKLKNNKNDTIVFVKGKENYIKDINNNIDNFFGDNNQTNIIDCYDINEVGEKAKDIVKQYDNILSTNGKKEFV